MKNELMTFLLPFKKNENEKRIEKRRLALLMLVKLSKLIDLKRDCTYGREKPILIAKLMDSLTLFLTT